MSWVKEQSEYLITNKRTYCKDGTSLSIQANRFTYCIPRDDIGPHTHVEVGFIEDQDGNRVTPSQSWKEYCDGDEFPNDVYAYVPIELVNEFILQHGGPKNMTILESSHNMEKEYPYFNGYIKQIKNKNTF